MSTGILGRPAKPRRAVHEKRCSRCRQVKRSQEFNADERNPDFLRSECADCQNAARRTAEGRAARAAYMRKYRARKRRERAA